MIFNNPEIANNYDAYYQTEFGKKVDEIEKDAVTDLIAGLPRCEMLELGCGTGHWTAFFEESGFNVTATDTSETMLNQAKKKNLEAGFQLADAQSLPFPKHSFEFVATITMLEFVDDPAKVFEEIYRVLKPGGWLLTGCLNANSVLGKNKADDEIFKHAKFFNLSELQNALQLFGEPEIKPEAYLTPNFKLLDGTDETGNTEPAFMAALVQKIK